MTLRAIVTVHIEPKKTKIVVKTVPLTRSQGVEPVTPIPLLSESKESKSVSVSTSSSVNVFSTNNLSKAKTENDNSNMKKNKTDEKLTSQVKSIYRDDGDTMLASVKHIRSTVYDNDDYQDTEEVEYKSQIPKIKEKTKVENTVENKVEEKRVPAWNYATAVDEVEETTVEGVNDEESMHITCMPTENLMCSKVRSHVRVLHNTLDL